VDRGAAVALTALVGGAVALQAPINSGLGRQIGTFQAALVSFTIGTLLLLAIVSLTKEGLTPIAETRHVAVQYLVGGALGVAYVSTVLVTVRTLGAGGLVAATIAGQLAASVVVDQLGILGVARQPITAAKLAGVALLAVGTYLIVRE
jgi:transporter family-2 protein